MLVALLNWQNMLVASAKAMNIITMEVIMKW